MKIPDELVSMFSARPEEEEDGSVMIQVPRSEVDLGAIESGKTYQVCLLERGSSDSQGETFQRRQPNLDQQQSSQSEPQPPVDEGEQREVTIESIGDQGDGVAKIDGYVIIVPETDVDERVLVKITDTRDSVAFAEVVKRLNTTATSSQL